MGSGIRVVQDEKGEKWLLKKKYSDLAGVDRVSGLSLGAAHVGKKQQLRLEFPKTPPPNVDRLSCFKTALDS